MRVYTLAAADGVPFAKRYFLDNGKIQADPYPNIRDVVSCEFETHSIEDLFEVLNTVSPTGQCLLKGRLNRPLRNESRAGATTPDDPTQYLVLDLDFEAGFDSVDAFLAELDPALADVSYILHHSSSAGIKYDPGLRAHIIILLDRPHSPSIIKQWLMHKNLTVPGLKDQLSLSANGMGLRFPLDVSTCQNDKLIFIADPSCSDGVVDPLAGNRFELHKKVTDFAEINFGVQSAQQNRDAADQAVESLRALAGLKKQKAKYKQYGQVEVLSNPDKCTVTGVKESRGFVYLNLNGGDSWAYYYPVNRPHLVHNFKNEPSVFLRDIAPDYFYQILKQQQDQKAQLYPLVFREPHTDTYYNALYDPNEQAMKILAPVQGKDRMKDFLAQHNVMLPDPIEDWTLEFDPTTTEVLNEKRRWINKFTPTRFMLDDNPVPAKIPTTINKILKSICVDQPTLDHFLNWLAYIFQTRKKTGTAWIFHGVPGTGKGLLHEKILQPLFGPNYTPKITGQQLKDQFNGYLETSIVLWLDEIKLDSSPVGDEVIDKLKHIITEDHTNLRLMRRNPIQIRSFANLILATNHPDPLSIGHTDRRFNVAPAQETPIDISNFEVKLIADELPLFAGWLASYAVDIDKAQHPLKNAAKDRMILAGEKSTDTFFRAVREGDLDYFVQFLRAKAILTPGNTYVEYERVVRRWVANRDSILFIPRDELMTAYAYLQNHASITPTKFSRMCTIQRLDIKPGRHNGVVMQGLLTEMTSTNDEQLEILSIDNVTEMKRA